MKKTLFPLHLLQIVTKATFQSISKLCFLVVIQSLHSVKTSQNQILTTLTVKLSPSFTLLRVKVLWRQQEAENSKHYLPSSLSQRQLSFSWICRKDWRKTVYISWSRWDLQVSKASQRSLSDHSGRPPSRKDTVCSDSPGKQVTRHA